MQGGVDDHKQGGVQKVYKEKDEALQTAILYQRVGISVRSLRERGNNYKLGKHVSRACKLQTYFHLPVNIQRYRKIWA